ncbi:MFS transporter [Curvibacter sp. HBC61]|uniref:MFS transporter n=1 Tax=Curvibacter cyanobacteriorum TaxID=3026422 RepID=A0ABT5N3N3_9BURK|nr:MFS transporter [Curvibacter sp. HBC61]MDD0840934.1 MFS transporter [Curvibacter sp. HBC61]
MASIATAVHAPPQTGSSPAGADALYRKISWRLMPLLLICYMVSYLDRINIGYAQLQMKETLPFSDTVYGLGAGIFFVGYFLFEVPSNLLLVRFGARKTLLRIMLCWGVVAAAMMWVSTPTQFYAARFLLGVFEAGFFPGIILYLTFWYPAPRRAQMIAIFMSATTVAGVIAGPLCGAILKYMDGLGGLHGWQWLFVVQGLPASVLGVVVYLYLQDRPDEAHWLAASDKQMLREQLAQEHPADPHAPGVARQLLSDPRIYALSLLYFLLLGATYTMTFWVPTLVQSWGVKDLLLIGVCTAIPNLFGIVGMVLIGRSSDRLRERRWHFAGAVLLAALCLGVTTLLKGQLVASVAALSVALIGIAAATPLFFTVLTERLSPAASAAGIALVSSLGNLGPAVSPSLAGYITSRHGPDYSIYLVMALYLGAGALMLLCVRARPAGVSRAVPQPRGAAAS